MVIVMVVFGGSGYIIVGIYPICKCGWHVLVGSRNELWLRCVKIICDSELSLRDMMMVLLVACGRCSNGIVRALEP